MDTGNKRAKACSCADALNRQEQPLGEWSDLVKPCVDRCEVAAKFGMNATWNSDGAAALGELIKTMAKTLDDENIRREAVTD